MMVTGIGTVAQLLVPKHHHLPWYYVDPSLQYEVHEDSEQS